MDNNEEERQLIAERLQIIQLPLTRLPGISKPSETQPEQGLATSTPPDEAMQDVQRLQEASRRSDRLADVFKNVPSTTSKVAKEQITSGEQKEGE